ncbi:calcium incorporation protein MxaA [Paraburkholderia sp.]|uniref:calcium incorporation protein MxaA n=1 Tax=Paraburkholderia sp. TaxID=1926495 RepID=UPI003D6FA194
MSVRALCRFAMVAALACATVGAAAQSVSATVQQPRAFGYTIGDVLEQRILLQAGGKDLGTVAAPSVGRTGLWLERRPSRVETDRDGRRWMVVGYQIVNAPQTLTRIALPAMTLGTAAGAALQVAEWPASVGPLTPADAFGAGNLQPMRPDRDAPRVAIAPLRQRLEIAAGLLIATLLVWAGWWLWRNHREAGRLPFARLWQRMRRVDPRDADTSVDAWLGLHHALNETAGQVVHAGALATLFDRAPHLQPLHERIERFYRQSAQRYFVSASSAASADPHALRDLCRALYLAERRRHR